MSRLSRFLLRLAELLTAELLVLGGVLFGAFLAFLLLTKLVFVDGPEAFDQQVFGWFDALRAAVPGLTPWVLRLTFFGSALWFVVAGLSLPALLWWLKLRRESVELLAAVAGAALLNQLLKIGFGRVRPLSALLAQPGLSFPSGHAMIGLALYGMLAWQLRRHGRHPVWAAVLLLWAVLIGLTRIYLHVHYPTDVLAGFAAAVSWLVLVQLTVRQRLRRA
ncbi:phosphatase PAP2 family protein [Hymenobacter busanensis]|uniref:Phosphatase PAP2 family protein n=1 Tax=Hymenobacter busanensis TaxID=2607656 RepID=A0A7L4ZVH7_9BACT|nr:phosphatase PAP2 family protein [Hymenobacter busanensis]KAA9332441.1 phosphatase PAP2 family protein [Hymenobacter busanensis]QHJ07221.1 phosphatase PAP2 family protein [Hymenobacter busanensis]